MENNEISEHELRFYATLQQFREKWLSHRDLAKHARIAQRTARAYTLRYVKLGILDVAEMFPRHLYRLSPKASKRNVGYCQRLARAAEIVAAGAESE